MKIEYRAKNTDDRLQRVVLISMACVLTSVFLCLSYSKAATWDPGDELRSYLSDNYPWEEIEISNVQVVGKIAADRPERILLEKGPLGKAVFSFIFANNDVIVVKANVRAFDWVVMSKRPFQKRHVIEDEDLYLTKMEIGKIPKNSVKEQVKILGKSLKRSVIANIPIEEDMIEMSQLVERGKSVVLLIEHNGMTVKASGKTREKSHVGMPVNAINLSSKKGVRGVLIDENTVKVEL
ncbi:MAG: flagellar basal body P-ring formation protein FlgA [Nitrospirae bacterium]|nr:flagellar basal body P-ring formation protein FlgA [Nitrospirota bacterium]